MVIIGSIIAALVFLSAGYGLWERSLSIKGRLTVNRPEFIELVIPKVGVTDAVYADVDPLISPIAPSGDALSTVPLPSGNENEQPYTEPSTTNAEQLPETNASITDEQTVIEAVYDKNNSEIGVPVQ